jgi:hypothetical protein
MFILMVLTLLLSACSPADVQEIEDILDPDNAEPSEAQREQMAGEGSADVYYHYHITHPDINFKIDMPFAINFAETDQLGSFDAQGIYEDFVTFQMAAGTDATRCLITCQVNLRFVATGSIELGEEGECEIPMNFSFVPQGDYLMDTTCPPETHDVVDCNALSMVLMDPTTYTFLSTDTELYVPSDPGVKREAEIKNLVFPEGMKGTCKW